MLDTRDLFLQILYLLQPVLLSLLKVVELVLQVFSLRFLVSLVNELQV